MALIKWKQIDPQLGSYGLLTGSLEVSGSLLVNGEVVTGVSGSNQSLSLNGYELSIENGNTVTLPSGSGGSASTGSLINSASVSNNVITFTKGDASTFSITIDTGSGAATPTGTISSSAQITEFGFISSSHTDIESLNAATSSYVTLSMTGSMSVLSASYAVSSSIEILTEVSSSHSVQADSASFISDTFISESALRGGFGAGVTLPAGVISSSAQITAVGFISSSHTDIESLNAATSSYITVSQTGSMTVLSASYAVSSSVEILTELSSSHAQQADTASFITDTFISASAVRSGFGAGGGGDVTFNGNRVVSQAHLPGFFTSSFNAGTSGSVQDFLNAVFFPNTGPSITSATQFNIAEFVASGSTITTLSATDPEAQALTFTTQSGYTDDLIKLSTGGVLTLNVTSSTEQFNTDDRGDGTLAHPVLVQVADTFGGTDTQTIYIDVTANSAPVFRQTSAAGSIITSFTSSRNENSTTGEIAKIYFTDANSDTITIRSGGLDVLNDKFTIARTGSYVSLRQISGSLDYETTSSYNFSLTASDEHYEGGEDLDARAFLPMVVNVTDNVVPVVNNQTLSSINENSSDGTSVATIAASDAEGDTITFTAFTLSSLKLNSGNVATGSYGGTSQTTDPHENPFSMASNGAVTRKNGVFLNSDLIDEYLYTVKVLDAYNTASAPAIITIPITDDTPATLSDNWSAGPYIVESDISSATIKTTLYGSTQADFGSNQSGAFTSSNAAIAINSTTGQLSLAVNLSGSATASGATINSTISFRNTFNTLTTSSLAVSVLGNRVPTASFSQQSPKFNSNSAVAGTTLYSGSITDPDGDAPYSASLTGPNANLFEIVYNNADSSSFEIKAISDVPAGEYNITASVFDSFAESQQVANSETDIVIATPGIGTMTTNGTFHIIESATNTANIVTNANGRTGTQGDLGVTYSGSFGSQAVTSFSSSNAQLAVSNAGALTLGFDLSGSGTASGDTISSNITFVDQYDNIGSGSITVNVATNHPPFINATSQSNGNENAARGTANLFRVTVADTESDALPSANLTVTGLTGSLSASVDSPYIYIKANNNNVNAGVYGFTASLADTHSFSTALSASQFTIAAADDGTLTGDTAVYILESTASGAPFRDATGYENGNYAQVGASYSPAYAGATVQSFTSSNAAIVIDGSGNLTLGVTLSGSTTQSGDTFSSTITFRDQYDNVGSGSVTATVFGNSSPVANFTRTNLYESDNATSGSQAGTLAVTDVENNTPFTFSVAGVNGDKFDVQGTSSPFKVQPTGSLDGGTYFVDLTVTDNYGESVTLTSESIIVTQSLDFGKVYVYTSTLGSDSGLTNAYNSVMGASTVNGDTPPQVTVLSAASQSLYAGFISGSMGAQKIVLSGGESATLMASGSGNNLDTVLSSSIGTITTGSTGQIVIAYPSGSDMYVPTSIQESFNSTVGGAVPAFNVDGGGFGIESGDLQSIELTSAHLGYNEWFVFGRKTRNAIASNAIFRLINSSGSLPS